MGAGNRQGRESIRFFEGWFDPMAEEAFERDRRFELYTDEEVYEALECPCCIARREESFPMWGTEVYRDPFDAAAEIQDALWAGDRDRLDELAPCQCCCHEHTFADCPARAWHGCRGSGGNQYEEYDDWHRAFPDLPWYDDDVQDA